jgi:hypothetical protein
VEPLHTKSVTVLYDEERRLIYMAYRGTLTSYLTIQAYDWLGQFFKQTPPHETRGTIVDFRAVEQFPNTNSLTTQNQDSRLYGQIDMSRHATALLVENTDQREHADLAISLSDNARCKRVVSSEAEALAFINQWNAEHGIDFGDVREDLLLTLPAAL